MDGQGEVVAFGCVALGLNYAAISRICWTRRTAARCDFTAPRQMRRPFTGEFELTVKPRYSPVTLDRSSSPTRGRSGHTIGRALQFLENWVGEHEPWNAFVSD